eukprot:8064444-Prorocentrum_lima.AAC.1
MDSIGRTAGMGGDRRWYLKEVAEKNGRRLQLAFREGHGRWPREVGRDDLAKQQFSQICR